MLDFIKKYIFKNAASQALKALLDKLPVDGGKLFLGLLLLVLSEVARELPAASFSPFVAVLIEVIQQLGPQNVQDAGIVAAIIGLVHKILKLFNKDLPDAPNVVS